MVLTDHLSRLRNQLPPLLTVTVGPTREADVVRPRQQQRRLTPEQVGQLVAEYLVGDDMKTLATRWQLHRTTVASHLAKAGVELRRQGIADPQLGEAIGLYNERWSCVRLTERYDCNGETVRQRLKTAGVQLRSPWERV